MPNSDQFHSPQVVFSHMVIPSGARRPLCGVWQDKGTAQTARIAFRQAGQDTKTTRAALLDTAVVRTQNCPPRYHKAEKVTSWIPPLVKAELERKSEQSGISLSKTIAAYLEMAVQQDIYRQNISLLKPMLKELLGEQFRALGNRMVFFLMRIAFACEQTRILVTKILHIILKREGVTEAEFDKVIVRSCDMAKRNIVHKTPQMKSLIAEWEGFGEDSEEKGRN